MKKIILFFTLFFLSVLQVNAKENEEIPVLDADIQIDYKSELLFITPEDSEIRKIYFAKVLKNDTTILNKIKNWEEVWVKEETAVIDISSFISEKDNYIALKLENSNYINNVVKIASLPKVKLAKEFDILTGEILLTDSKDSTKIIPSEQIEIRKGKRGYWEEWDIIEEKEEQIEIWQRTGTTIYVRAMAVNEEDNSQLGTPASNEIPIKIKKLKNAPKLIVDGSRLTVRMKRDTEYRINNKDMDDKEDWTVISDLKTKEIPLYELTEAGIEENKAVAEDITIEYRSISKVKNNKIIPASKINTIQLKAQAEGPVIGKEIKIEKAVFLLNKKYTAEIAICVNIPEKDYDGYDREYEYLIIKNEDSKENSLIKGWKTLTTKEIRLKQGSAANQIAEGDKILFRAKMVKENNKKQKTFQLASGYTEFIVSGLEK